MATNTQGNRATTQILFAPLESGFTTPVAFIEGTVENKRGQQVENKIAMIKQWDVFNVRTFVLSVDLRSCTPLTIYLAQKQNNGRYAYFITVSDVSLLGFLVNLTSSRLIHARQHVILQDERQCLHLPANDACIIPTPSCHATACRVCRAYWSVPGW